MDKSELELRPELLFGPNPFISEFPPALAFSELPARLLRYPLEGTDWRKMRPQYREPLLNAAINHFAPYEAILEPAAGLQILFRRALVLLNPVAPGAISRVNRIALAEDHRQMRSIASLDGAGAIWDGITGTGRTALKKRMLEILSPEQVIHWGSSEACGWHSLKQVCWLHIDQPSNGSRGALIKRIFAAIDEALGTSYFDDYRRVDNIDSLLTSACRLLATYRVVLLVIDELQSGNFAESPWQMEFVLFYLSTMNLGISVLLIGNPLAFQNIYRFSQVVRRFSVGGICHFLPAATCSTPWWHDDFCPRIRKFSVIEQCDVDPATRDQFEHEHSGGLPGLCSLLNTEMQRSALRRTGPDAEAVLSICDMKAALETPRYTEALKVARAVSTPPASLSDGDYADTPTASKNETADAHSLNGVRPTVDAVEAARRIAASFTAKQSRALSTAIKKMGVISRLTEDELRMLGISESIVAAATSDASKPRKQKSRSKGK
jgi:hypothetical protein